MLIPGNKTKFPGIKFPAGSRQKIPGNTGNEFPGNSRAGIPALQTLVPMVGTPCPVRYMGSDAKLFKTEFTVV